MNNRTTYALLVHSQEKGRTIMETSAYIVCVLSVVAAIFQFVMQPSPDPFAGFSSPAQPTPILSHHPAEAAWDTKS
jgi:ABC-type sugar transport system permease subunit